MINEWIRLGYTLEEVAELEKLSLIPSTVAEFKEITDVEIADMFGITTEQMYKEIKEGTFVCSADLMKDYAKEQETRLRAHKLHSGDVIYCNVEAMKELDENYMYYDMHYGGRKLGDHIALYFKEHDVAFSMKVIEVFKEKKYPNKKWWHFWLKQEETVTGYNLMVL